MHCKFCYDTMECVGKGEYACDNCGATFDADEDPPWTAPVVAEEHRNPICTCGNPEMGFNCTCEWAREHKGNILFSCEFCGIYEASEPRCNKCEWEKK